MVRRTRLVEAVVQGQTLAIEVMRAAAAGQTDIATGKSALAINNLGRLGLSAQQHFHEFRRLAAEVEE